MQPKKEDKNLIDVFVGKRLRIVRGARCLSEEEVAKKSGLPLQHVIACEAGEKRATAPMLYKLANALEISITSLFDGVQHYMQLTNYEHKLISVAGAIADDEAREEIMGILILLQRLPSEKRQLVIQFIETLTKDIKPEA